MKKVILWLGTFLSPFFFLHAETLTEEVPVVILGSGIGALTSAVYLSRAGIPPIVITGEVVGGTITQSHNVQNWPGEISISGAELGEKVKKQAELSGAFLRPEVVVSVDFSKRPYRITTKQMIASEPQMKIYQAASVIIALGSSPNFLHIPGETRYFSRGVYTCAVCDGWLYKDRTVAIVGGGDSALIEAQYLSNIAFKVHVFVRKEQWRATEKQRLKDVLAMPNVEVHYNTVVEEIRGDAEKVTHLRIKEQTQSRELPIDALFLAIGSQPNTALLRGQIELDDAGYIILKSHQQTSLEGVYAIGDVADPEFKQAVSAAGDAAKAAIQAQKFLSSHPLPSWGKKQAIAHEPVTKPIEVTSKEQFEKELKSAETVVFVDFYSTYCGPCRTFSPVYDTWAQSYAGKIKFLKVNADHVPEIFRQYQIRAVPTLLIFDAKGQVIRTSTGFYEISEVEKKLQKLRDRSLVTSGDFILN